MQSDEIYPNFVDFRSARREHQRTRRYPRKVSRSKRYCCEVCRPHYHWMRLHRNKEARYTVQNQPWDDDFAFERRFEEEPEHMDVVVLFNWWGKRRDVIQRFDDVKGMVGETFEQWGRRQMGEIQTVKEDRIRASPSVVVKYEDTDEVNGLSTPNTYSTTLPTSGLDTNAHDILKCILTPNEHLLRWLRAKEPAPFRQIQGFECFGECCWKWHCNRSGCWEIGYISCEYPLLCQYYALGEEMHKFCCSEFHEAENPEAQQSCCLIEWTSEKLRQIIIMDAATVVVRPEEEANTLAEGDDGWEVVSDSASDCWNVIPYEPNLVMRSHPV